MSPPDREGRDGAFAAADEPESRCASCRELYPTSALDQRLWCPPCRDELARKLRWGSHVTALAITVPFAVWVYMVRTTEVLSPWAWVLPRGAAYYLGWRIGKELIKGWVRLKSRGE